MSTRLAILLAIAGALAAGVAIHSATEGHVFDGCEIHLVSEASRAVDYRVEFRGAAERGTLAPGERETVDLCLFSPRDFPAARVVAEGLGEATVRLDPYCSDWEILVNDTRVVPGGRTCT